MGSDNNNMSTIFEKLADMKTLFQYGQKIVPILENLVDFMQETVPLLENINHSIADSTSKIPRATHQINDVTSATELATTEILDLVDVISLNLREIEKKLKNIKSEDEQKIKLLQDLKIAVQGNKHAENIVDEILRLSKMDIIESLLKYFPKLLNDTLKITLSLQIQDITSQQLAAVNHLIESVQDKLSSLIIDIDDIHVKEAEPQTIEPPKNVTFDPNASYYDSTARQNMVDSLVKNHKASQDEIDKLFS